MQKLKNKAFIEEFPILKQLHDITWENYWETKNRDEKNIDYIEDPKDAESIYIKKIDENLLSIVPYVDKTKGVDIDTHNEKKLIIASKNGGLVYFVEQNIRYKNVVNEKIIIRKGMTVLEAIDKILNFLKIYPEYDQISCKENYRRELLRYNNEKIEYIIEYNINSKLGYNFIIYKLPKNMKLESVIQKAKDIELQKVKAESDF